MYFFVGFFFESHLVYVLCFPHFTYNSLEKKFNCFLGHPKGHAGPKVSHYVCNAAKQVFFFFQNFDGLSLA
jgi:hypothetical protein